MLDCQRRRFRLPEDVHYLNCAYMAPLAREVEEAGVRGMARRRDPSTIVADDFFRDADALRARFARLVGGSDPRRVAILPAVSYGIGVAARNAPVSGGQNIVVLGEQFPSNVYAWMRKARENGAALRTVKRPSARRPGSSVGSAWNERVLEAIDSNTAVVALPIVHWADGTLIDAAAVGRRAREVGALFVIDVQHERIAVSEANKLGIPVIAVVDTNSDPEGVEQVIPGNDDAIRAIRLYVTAVADAVHEGRARAAGDVEPGTFSEEGGFVEVTADAPEAAAAPAAVPAEAPPAETATAETAPAETTSTAEEV